MTIHGHCRQHRPTPTYRAWVNMLSRCYNEKSTSYPFYGGRGISVCNRWRLSFVDFIADVGERPSPRHSMDRVNTNGNYEPANVRWVTHTEQCRNRRSNISVIRGDGISYRSLAEAAEAVDGTIGGIWDVCNGNQYRHRGFEWRYA